MYLLFDIGGTNMRIATADKRRIIRTRTVPTPRNFSEAMVVFRKVAGELARGKRWAGAAGCTPGPLDAKLTKLVSAPNLPHWNGKPVKLSLQRILGCPVRIMKDVGAAVLGEAVFGAGKGKRIVAYYTVSTGVGGARSIDGRLDETTAWAEPGWQFIMPGDKHGYLEGLVSGTGLKRRYGLPSAQIADKKIWAQTARFLAIGIHNTIVHWRPDVVVVGGSVMKRLPIAAVRRELELLPTIINDKVKILPAKLGDQAGLYGALAVLTKKKGA